MSEFIRLDAITRRFVTLPSLTERVLARLGGSASIGTTVHAVEGVSLEVAKGKTLGLVGESGYGKSTPGRLAAGILEPDHGTAQVGGEAVRSGGRKRGTCVQMVFQDPFASLAQVSQSLMFDCAHSPLARSGRKTRRLESNHIFLCCHIRAPLQAHQLTISAMCCAMLDSHRLSSLHCFYEARGNLVAHAGIPPIKLNFSAP